MVWSVCSLYFVRETPGYRVFGLYKWTRSVLKKDMLRLKRLEEKRSRCISIRTMVICMGKIFTHWFWKYWVLNKFLYFLKFDFHSWLIFQRLFVYDLSLSLPKCQINVWTFRVFTVVLWVQWLSALVQLL